MEQFGSRNGFCPSLNESTLPLPGTYSAVSSVLDYFPLWVHCARDSAGLMDIDNGLGHAARIDHFCSGYLPDLFDGLVISG